jgi:hypothetical protein
MSEDSNQPGVRGTVGSLRQDTVASRFPYRRDSPFVVLGRPLGGLGQPGRTADEPRLHADDPGEVPPVSGPSVSMNPLSQP